MARYTSRRGIAAVLLGLALLFASSALAAIRPAPFAIPPTIIPIGDAVTPAEYAQLMPAIETWEREHAQALREGMGLGDLNRIAAAHVNLGSLGEAIIAWFRVSGSMALFTPEAKGYHLALMGGGWGYALLPSGGSVPDVAFYSKAGPLGSGAQLYHFAHGEFVTTNHAACTGANSRNAICAALGRALANMRGMAISPSEYDALRPAVEAAPGKPSTARSRPFDNAHAVGVLGMQLVSATAVGMGACSASHNCDISIYAREDGRDWPLLRAASGWGVTSGRLMGAAPAQVAFIVARHLPANQDLLTRYISPLATTNHLGDLTHSSRLLPDACEIVTPKSGHWPAQWDAAALTAQPVPCFPTTSPAQTRVLAADTTSISAVAQADDGTVWAAGGGRSGQLYRWQRGGWSNVPSPIPVSTASPLKLEYLRANGLIPQPEGVWPGPNGGVLVDWLDPTTQESELYWQRGNQAKLLAAAASVRPGAHLDIEIVASAASRTVVITRDQQRWQNGIPVSGQPAGIFGVSKDGRLERIYTFAPDQYLPYRIPTYLPPFFQPIQITRDAEGRVWIWCGWLYRGEASDLALEGFVVTDGKTVQYERRIQGLPNAHLVSLDAWDSSHLAAATFGGGLYTIDTATFEAQPVAEPRSGAFRFVKKVFRTGNDRYVLTFDPDVVAGATFGAMGAVWRLRDGHWKQVLQDQSDISNIGVATSGGLWLATSDFRGLWFIPVHGSARRETSLQGLSINDVKQLFQLPGGDILATGAGHFAQTRAVEFNPEALLKKQATASAGFTVIYPRTRLQPDRQRNFWGILQPGALSEWNGSQWIAHPFPPMINPSRIVALDIDARGRVWLFPNCRLGPMGIFNPAEDRWTTYQGYRDALARSTQPVHFLHPEDDRMRPIYGPNSQIVFVGMCWGVNYFDGSSWHLWNQRQLPGPLDLERPPFFDASGHMAFDPAPNVRRLESRVPRPGWNKPTTWEWTADSLWHIVPYEPGETVRLPNPFAALPPPPGGCATMSPSSLVQDSTGRTWWVADGALYKGITGQCQIVLPASASQPFIDGRQLVRVLLDARGNAFLETHVPFSYVVLRRSADAAPAQTNARRTK